MAAATTMASYAPTMQDTNIVLSTLRAINTFIVTFEEDPENASEENVVLLIELIEQIIDSSHLNWNLIANEITELARFYECVSTLTKYPSSEIAPKLAYLLSLLYFHLENYELSCEWALLAGSIISQDAEKVRDEERVVKTLDAYRRNVTTGLVEHYASAHENQSDSIRSRFVFDLISNTIEAAKVETDQNKQREQILMVYGIAIKAENINWIVSLLTNFPSHGIFLLNHHIRRLSSSRRAWNVISETEALPPNPSEGGPRDFKVECLKVLIDAAAVLTHNLTGIQNCPFTNFDFEMLKGQYHPVSALTEDNRAFLTKHKGGERLQCIQSLQPAAEQLASEIEIEGEKPTAVPQEQQTITIDEPTEEEKAKNEEEYATAHKLHTKAILYIQPFIDIWDGLVYLWDARRINKMIINLIAGKACWINGVPSSEGRVLALQLILDLVLFENPRLVKLIADAQASFPSRLKESNKNILKRVSFCLSGRVSSHLRLECLSRFSKAEMKLLEQLRQTANGSESLVHQGLMLCHGIITAGTTSDIFLRHNVDWYKRAVCWAKFTGASTLGLTHRGHTENSKSSGLPRSLTILRNYLPPTPGLTPNGDSATSGNSSGGTYSEGGGLYAVGLIHACAPSDVVKTMFLHHLTHVPDPPAGQAPQEEDSISGGRSDPVHHGSALALGLVYASTKDSDVLSALKDALHKDNSIIGEAAALAIGMVGCNSGDTELEASLLEYADETHHQKIQRSCGLGVAFLNIERNSEADETIDKMLSHYNSYVRMGGIWTLAAAYAGTGCTKAVKRLLDTSVDDSSDDVVRTAIIAIGFILGAPQFRHSLISTISLLVDSYNPHVRYGAAIALGVGAASTGDLKALGLLRPLAEDATSFVRHGALMALGLVICSKSEGENKIYHDVRKDFFKVVKTKQEDPMVRFGALLGIGIGNAGGGNVSISLTHAAPRGSASTKAYHLDTISTLGMMLFCSYWDWFPLINCITLSMKSTVACGITYRLQVPHDYCLYDTNAPKDYDYPEPTPDPAPKKSKQKTSTLINKRMLRRRRPGPTNEQDSPKKKAELTELEKEEKEKEEKEKEEAENEPGFWVSLPARITDARAKGITSGADKTIKSPPYFTEEQLKKIGGRPGKIPVVDCGCTKNEVPHSRYIPIMHKRHEGVIVLLDRWSELRMPVLSNVIVAMESKKKPITTEAGATAATEGTNDDNNTQALENNQSDNPTEVSPADSNAGDNTEVESNLDTPEAGQANTTNNDDDQITKNEE